MADRQDIENRVVQLVARVLKLKVDQIKPESDFVKDLAAESIQSIELVASFEDEFDIEMDNAEALAVQTVGGAVDFIARYVEQKEASAG